MTQVCWYIIPLNKDSVQEDEFLNKHGRWNKIKYNSVSDGIKVLRLHASMKLTTGTDINRYVKIESHNGVDFDNYIDY